MKYHDTHIPSPSPDHPHKSHSFPLAKLFKIDFPPGIPEFAPTQIDVHNLPCCWPLKNLQQLSIDSLQLSEFMPNFKQYFGRFASNLLSLALTGPRGSIRQILYFIGHFENLQDFKLCCFSPAEEDETTANLKPPFKPPLCGWLTLNLVEGKEFVDEMIVLFGGLHFRYVGLYGVACAQQVLNACAGTLEILWLDERNLDSEDFFE